MKILHFIYVFYASIKEKPNKGKIYFIFPLLGKIIYGETLLHLVDILGEKLMYYLYLCK